MRIVLVHPNYHSGGAEIAGSWPPAWVAYLAGALKQAGYTDVTFIDAMTDHLDDDTLRARIREARPDVIGTTAITPSIYAAERILQLAQEELPGRRARAGRHARHLHVQAGLSEAPWVDVIVRGEGEEISSTDARHREGALAEAACARSRASPSLTMGRSSPPRRPHGQGPRRRSARLEPLEWSKYIYVPLGVRVAIPNMARGCPFTCSFCSQWKFWRDYRVRDPKKVVDEIEEPGQQSRSASSSSPTRNPPSTARSSSQFCEELIARGLPDKVKWGINTRVTDIMRDKELLPLYRKAGLVHVSLGTEAAAQLKLDQFNKETKVAENKEAIRLLREADIFVEAQFIVGLDNETAETLKKPTAWPGTGSRISPTGRCTRPGPSRRCSRNWATRSRCSISREYNFVTPIMKPEAMDRASCSTG
jgi:anaerobic magnesium-protoporphyrin IX monomethyl ester cyclase